MYRRLLQLADIASKKSIFLLGPRQTGKSTLIRDCLPDAKVFNLLDMSIYRRLSADPSAMRRELLAMPNMPPVVVIDEIQRLPDLLNEVHLLIEEQRIRFVLTGSSARSLRRKGVNLLGGRARSVYFHPLVSHEIGESFDLLRALNHGLLPFIYDADDSEAELADYCGTYLREEIAAEGLVRNIPSFSRFLELSASCSTQILNYTKIASDAEIKRTTVMDYFNILRDTLLAYDLPAWQQTTKRKPITSSKFYFFDMGVTRFLSGVGIIQPKNPTFGTYFEHFIFHELRSALDYG
jgi:predicted AAA+ superfamily ATPase